MKVALSADWQFDEYPNLSTITPSGITSRLVDQLDCFQWYLDEALALGCDALIIAGDLFDSRTVLPLSVIDVVCRAFDVAAERFHPDMVHVVVGNHDSWLRSPTVNSLRMLSGLATVHETPTIWGDFAFVPWTDDAEEQRRMIEALSKRKEARYLVTHALLKGVTGGPKGMPQAYLKPRSWSRIMLGDVHDPREIDSQGRIQYIGAPMHLEYGDAYGKRGFKVLDTETADVEFVENTRSPKFFVADCPGQLLDVKERDFVRIKTDDVEEAEELVAAAKGVATHVESTVVKVESDAPRLGVRSCDPHEQALTQYCEHQGIEAPEELVDVGLSILQEAMDG